ncbi:hypothetical protein BDV3_002235 [Batrachochytrium dendrobatidis]|uniref:Amino acid transporter transmembrane domain-containing protein n=1 Tax=Batrachochytrium dendrobatidis (strain JEL423) TaxID=403673 RepID=A0A177WWZ0_BATDL|nr:hypothetical protein BDEG_27806 [Batrachochytrium dendrobatidis JEL423]
MDSKQVEESDGLVESRECVETATTGVKHGTSSNIRHVHHPHPYYTQPPRPLHQHASKAMKSTIASGSSSNGCSSGENGHPHQHLTPQRRLVRKVFNRSASMASPFLNHDNNIDNPTHASSNNSNRRQAALYHKHKSQQLLMDLQREHIPAASAYSTRVNRNNATPHSTLKHRHSFTIPASVELRRMDSRHQSSANIPASITESSSMADFSHDNSHISQSPEASTSQSLFHSPIITSTVSSITRSLLSPAINSNYFNTNDNESLLQSPFPNSPEYPPSTELGIPRPSDSIYFMHNNNIENKMAARSSSSSHFLFGSPSRDDGSFHSRRPSVPIDLYNDPNFDIFDASMATPNSFSHNTTTNSMYIHGSFASARSMEFPDYGGTRTSADSLLSNSFDGNRMYKTEPEELHQSDSQETIDSRYLRQGSFLRRNTVNSTVNTHGRPCPSVLTSTIDLCNTIMGTGLMSIPYAFATVGIGYGSFLILCSAAATWFSVRLLISSAQLAYGTGTGRIPQQTSLFIQEGEPSYGALARTAMGRQGAMWADIAMSACCYGFAVSYLVSIADSMPKAAAVLFPEFIVGSWLYHLFQIPQFWMFAFLVLIAPLCYAKSVDEFWWFSSTCLGAALYIAFAVILLSYSAPHPHKGVDQHEDIPWFSVRIEAFQTISIYIFAFTCHQNIFSVYNEVGATYRGESVAPETVRHIRRVVDLSIIAVAILYLAVGICGFLAFGNSSMVLILDNFPDTPFITFARLMYALLAALSVPIQVHPCRACLDSVLTTFAYQSRYTRLLAYHTLAETITSPITAAPYMTSNLFWYAHRSLHSAMQQEHSRSYILTTSILVFTYLMSLWFNTLEDVLSFVGGTGGVIMCFVMPALFYWNLTTPETGGWRRPFSVMLAATGSICGILNIGWLVVSAVYR